MAREHGIRQRGRRIRGSVTLVTLCLMTTLGIALTSYIALSSRSAQLGTRLLRHDQALQLAQTGLEEALWALNQNNWTTSGPDGNASWSTSGTARTVTLSYALSDGASGRVSLEVTDYAGNGPTWPVVTAAATVTLAGGETFTKTLRATTAPAPLFGNAIASSESIVSFADGGTVDSWNSDPDNNPATPAVPYSFTEGNASNHAAVVAGRGDGTHGVALTQATIRGYVTTFGLPVSYSTSGSPAAKVLGPTTAASVNVDPSRLGKSAFVPLADVFSVTPPATTGTNYGGLIGTVVALVNALLGGSTTTDVYKVNNLTIGGNNLVEALLNPNLTVNRPLRLIVAGDLAVKGSGRITITETGSLQLFVSGDVTIGGEGIDNQTGDPKKLAVFSTGTSTSDALQYSTSRDFCGVILCEHKPIEIRENADFYGALLSRQAIRFRHNATDPRFHYDIALRHVRFAGVTSPYVVKNVTEL